MQKLEADAHIKTFLEGAYKESKVELIADANDGAANITVINTVGEKLPVTGSAMMLLMLGAGTVLVGYSLFRSRKEKTDTDEVR